MNKLVMDEIRVIIIIKTSYIFLFVQNDPKYVSKNKKNPEVKDPNWDKIY